MNNILQEDFIPVSAIIVYSQVGEYNEHYLESRRINAGESGYEMLEGTPLTKELLAGMLEEIDPKKLEKLSCDGFLPKNLLSYSNDNAQQNMIWYVESSAHKLNFIKGLGIKNGTMHLPTLVFKLVGSKLSVFAVKTNNVTEETKLYKAPFHNIYSDGHICMGSAKVIKAYDVRTLMKSWEDAFFLSKFTELHSDDKVINGNLSTYIKRQIKSKGHFDKNVLIPVNETVEDLL
jgi:PRTRC genetic system protein B